MDRLKGRQVLHIKILLLLHETMTCRKNSPGNCDSLYQYENMSSIELEDDARIEETTVKDKKYCGFCEKEFHSLDDFRNCLLYTSDAADE